MLSFLLSGKNIHVDDLTKPDGSIKETFILDEVFTGELCQLVCICTSWSVFLFHTFVFRKTVNILPDICK